MAEDKKLTVCLVRHADAGDRSQWKGPDDQRPVSPRGRRQARGLVELLRDRRVDRIVSSPSIRCKQTVEPLAAARGLPLIESSELAEGKDARAALRLMARLGHGGAVLCSHGDVIGDLVDWLQEEGIIAGSARYPKGSTWVLQLEKGKVASASFLPAPDG